MQGSVRALKAAPKLHSYNGIRNKNSDTQKYTVSEVLVLVLKDSLTTKFKFLSLFWSL